METDRLMDEFLQAARGQGYSDLHAEMLLGLACSPEAEAYYGDLDSAVIALTELCRQCKDHEECFKKFLPEHDG